MVRLKVGAEEMFSILLIYFNSNMVRLKDTSPAKSYILRVISIPTWCD